MWFAAYVVLMVVPMVVAIAVDPFTVERLAPVEISVALGLIGFPVILAQFALVSHLRAASRPFGTDALMQVHRYMGFLALWAIVVLVATTVVRQRLRLSYETWRSLHLRCRTSVLL